MAKRLTLWTASQSPYTQRDVFAQALAPLGLSHKDIRVITPYVGGGFGGKAGVSMEIIGAALATVVKGRPVKVRWTREQEFYNTYQRQGVVARIKLGAKKDGTFTAIEHDLYWDAGAYVEYGANVVNAAGLVGHRALPDPEHQDRLAVHLHQPAAGRSLPRVRVLRVPLRTRDPTSPGWPRRSAWIRSSSGGRTPSSRGTRSPTASR